LSKNGYIQIPNSIIKNPKVNPIDFSLLVKFKYLYYDCGNNYDFEIDLQKLKLNLYINDNRTIKKCFENLYELRYIKEQIEIKKRKPIHIKLNEKWIKEKPFTQLQANILDWIEDIDYVGIRLLYYYESFINRSIIKNQFCFASMDTIGKDTGITKKTLIKYNEILVKSKLLKIEKHKLTTEYNYTENDELVFDKYNNHYSVKVGNITGKNR
jgi:hypothetical protein